MAVASAWAKPGSWALAAEEQDELPPLAPLVVPAADFPDLATAATTKVPKKKKAQPIPLAEFNTGKYVLHSSRRPASEEIPDLPKEELASAPRRSSRTLAASGPRAGAVPEEVPVVPTSRGAGDQTARTSPRRAQMRLTIGVLARSP
ncbi:unnamed protein product [Miscanthus lutarioriparius]|uniref:Uncharacterized protein n=1 Tax=Miscanthus lutarioriparius TaxID=422564 RepID=A0A811Q6C2_9POAL|nr:unnamed protein product [Miscanthus lutarioriparius]